MCAVCFCGLRRTGDLEDLLVVKIPSDATEIDDNAFEGCGHLIELSISDTVTDIGECL